MRSSSDSAHTRGVQAQSRIMAMCSPRLVAFIGCLTMQPETPRAGRPQGRKLLREENDDAIYISKPIAGVELQAKRGLVGSEQCDARQQGIRYGRLALPQRGVGFAAC